MRLLKAHGWEIHVAARNNLDEKDGLQLEYPDRVYDIPFQRSPLDRRNLKAYRQLKQLLASTRYDVIHCNTPVAGVLTRLAARQYRKNGTQVYYTAHGFHFYRGAPAVNWLLYFRRELNGRAFLGDPDVFFLREQNCKLTAEEKEKLYTVNALLGGVLLTSDALNDYTEAQREQFAAVRRLKEEATDVSVCADDGVVLNYTLDGTAHALRIL